MKSAKSLAKRASFNTALKGKTGIVSRIGKSFVSDFVTPSVLGGGYICRVLSTRERSNTISIAFFERCNNSSKVRTPPTWNSDGIFCCSWKTCFSMNSGAT